MPENRCPSKPPPLESGGHSSRKRPTLLSAAGSGSNVVGSKVYAVETALPPGSPSYQPACPTVVTSQHSTAQALPGDTTGSRDARQSAPETQMIETAQGVLQPHRGDRSIKKPDADPAVAMPAPAVSADLDGAPRSACYLRRGSLVQAEPGRPASSDRFGRASQPGRAVSVGPSRHNVGFPPLTANGLNTEPSLLVPLCVAAQD